MITETDALNSLEFSDYYVILPSTPLWDVDRYAENFAGTRCEPGFSYCSGTNTQWLTVAEIRELIRAEVDPSFSLPVRRIPTDSVRRVTLKTIQEDLKSHLVEA
jgi:hypothetical protein